VVYELVVDEKARGQGIGKQLISHVEDFAKKIMGKLLN
jgi:GNAT superfamily N-acetyltransferase